jgi:hypothetical protein
MRRRLSWRPPCSTGKIVVAWSRWRRAGRCRQFCDKRDSIRDEADRSKIPGAYMGHGALHYLLMIPRRPR